MITALEIKKSGIPSDKIKIYEKRKDYTRTQEIDFHKKVVPAFNLLHRLEKLGLDLSKIPNPPRINELEEILKDKLISEKIGIKYGEVHYDDGDLNFHHLPKEGDETESFEEITAARAIIQADRRVKAFEDSKIEQMDCFNRFDYVFVECTEEIKGFQKKGNFCIIDIETLGQQCGILKDDKTTSEELLTKLKEERKCLGDQLSNAYIVKDNITKTPRVFSKIGDVPLLRVGNSAAQFPFTSSLSTHRGSEDADSVVKFLSDYQTDEKKRRENL